MLASELMGVVGFTRLSDREERYLNVGDIPPRERATDFRVAAYRNTAAASAQDWARARPENARSTVELAGFGGSDAARVTSGDAIHAVSYVVRADDRIYVVAADQNAEGATTAPLFAAVAASLRPVALGPFPTASTKTARDAAREVSEQLTAALASRDADAVAGLTAGCTIAISSVLEPPQPIGTCCVLNRAIAPFIDALRAGFASGDVTVHVDSALQSFPEGGMERYFVTSQWTEAGKTRQIDLIFDQRGGRSYWSAARHHVQLIDHTVCYGKMWAGDYQGPPC